MSDLTDFLSARIAEDEAVAGRCSVDHFFDGEDTSNDQWHHIMRFDPRRVFAECDAKRSVLLRHTPGLADYSHLPDECIVCTQPYPCETLGILARIYDTHPDYREEWRP